MCEYNTFKKSGNDNRTLSSQHFLNFSITTWSTFKDSNLLIFPALGAMCKWQQILYEQNGRLWLRDCFYLLSWFGNSLNKIILQAVTTTHLIKYNTVKHNMLHSSKYNEMNVNFFFFFFKSSPKAETAKHEWAE